MRTMLRWLPSAMLLLWSAGATAETQELSVLLLHHICHDTEARSQATCSGFLVGLLAGLQLSAELSRDGKPLNCVLGNVTQEKLVAMLDKLVTEKPEFAALPGLKALGLQVAFPCPPRPLPPKK